MYVPRCQNALFPTVSLRLRFARGRFAGAPGFPWLRAVAAQYGGALLQQCLGRNTGGGGALRPGFEFPIAAGVAIPGGMRKGGQLGGVGQREGGTVSTGW